MMLSTLNGLSSLPQARQDYTGDWSEQSRNLKQGMAIASELSALTEPIDNDSS
jgi:hypothetical protein